MNASSPSRTIGRAWMLFDWAAQPYFTLIATFIFPPFFVDQIVGDPIRGQTMWGMTSACAALLVGIAAPLIGARADRTGQTGLYFMRACAIGIVGAIGLWFCVPQAPYAINLAIIATITTAFGFEIATSLNNAMLRNVTRPEGSVDLAWKGWALGGASGTLALLIFIALIFPAQNNRTILGLAPLVEFSDPTSGPARFTGPFTALWFLVFIIPICFFYRKLERQERPQQSQSLKQTPWVTPQTIRFLIANLILADALLALFVFGGLYASAIFQWGPEKLALLGIALTIAGFVGVVVGLYLDRLFGIARVALGACSLLLGGGLFILGLDPENLWLWPSQPWTAFLSSSELAFILAALVIGASAALLQSALRVMFLSYAPREQMARSFGLFALSGRATSFLGPLLVSLVIAYFADTKAGMAVILIMIACGAFFLLGHQTARQKLRQASGEITS